MCALLIGVFLVWFCYDILIHIFSIFMRQGSDLVFMVRVDCIIVAIYMSWVVVVFSCEVCGKSFEDCSTLEVHFVC